MNGRTGWLGRTRRRDRAGAILAACALALVFQQPAPALADSHDANEASESGSLTPSYEPAPVPAKPIYTTDYFFAFTRGVANSTMVPAAQVPLFFLTIPLDAAFLPLAAIAGFFPGD